AGGFVDVGEQVAGIAYVVDAHRVDSLVHGCTISLELVDLLVVGVALGHGTGEDGGVGGDTDDGFLLDDLLEVTGGDAVAGEVVQPGGRAELKEVINVGHADQLPFHGVRGGWGREDD